MNILRKSSIRQFLNKHKRSVLWTLLLVLLLGSVCLSLWVGASEVSLSEALADRESADFRILFYIRLPRTLGGLLAGAALAMSGVIIQAVLQNPMAAPNLIGISGGAGFFTILFMAVFPSLIGMLPLAAFLGALLAALLIYAISAMSDASRVTVTLVGIAVGSILTAGINTVKVLFPDSVYDVSGFLIGGLSGVSLGKVLSAAVMILPACLLSLMFARNLDILSLGDPSAGSLGVSVRSARLLWLTLAAILAGAAVSYAGLIGFVGLIVPHVIRRLAGGSHGILLPASALGGGSFLLLADTVCRTAFAPYELPVGILLALVGGPFFIVLILSKRRGEV